MPQPHPPSQEAAPRDRDFVLWPEENGGKPLGSDLQAVASTLSAGEVVAPGESLFPRAGADSPDEGHQEPVLYPATSTWRRTTSRASTTEQDRWWEAGLSREGGSVGPPPPTSIGAPPNPPLLSPDEIWEMTARELEDASILRTKAQAPAPQDPNPPAEVIALEVEAKAGPKSPFAVVEPVVRQLSGSLRASPFTIAARAEAPLRISANPRAGVALEEELVFPRAGEYAPAPKVDVRMPDVETAPSRPVVTFWRLVFFLLIGGAVAAFLWRDDLAGLDWRAMWRSALHSMESITKDPPAAPVGKAVPLPTPVRKTPASADGLDPQLIRSSAPPAAPDPAALLAPPATGSASARVDPLAGTAPSSAVDDGSLPGGAGGSDPAGEQSRPPDADGFGTENISSTLWSGDDSAATPKKDPRAEEGGLESQLPIADQAEATIALAAVQNLITADSIDKVLPWIFEADKLGAMVRDYHAMQPLKALTGAVVEMEYSGVIPSSGDKAFIFNVLHPDHPRGFPMSAEHTPDGYRIDWQSYIQWRDEWLRRFVEKKATEPQMLFVVLRRIHYFNSDVPRLDEKLCFKISSAVPGDEGAFAFADHQSGLGRSLAATYEWRKLYFPVVELQWVREPNSEPYVRLNRIVRPTWRRVGD